MGLSPEELSRLQGMTPGELQKLLRLERVAKRRSAQHYLADFCEVMDEYYVRARHAELLCEHLEAVERDDVRYLMVFEPPRHSKSYHVSERFPAFYLARNPRKMVILASYGLALATQANMRARNMFGDERWPFPDVKLQTGATDKTRWYTEAGGSSMSAGVDAAITGFGAHLLIVDDPIKGRNEANSPVQRESCWNWWTNDAQTRLMPRGSVIVCQTRWHDDDLSGRILNGPTANDWTVLCLPALAEEGHGLQPHGDPLGRQPGDALWPEWFDKDYLLRLREGMSSSDWNAVYQQRPVAAEGGTFKRAWWGFYTRQGLAA